VTSEAGCKLQYMFFYTRMVKIGHFGRKTRYNSYGLTLMAHFQDNAHNHDLT